MQNRYTRKAPSSGKQHFFYFNIADESHAKILEQTRKVDPMQSIGRVLSLDEY